MTGTWINMAAIVAGAVLGMLAKKGIPHRVEESLTRIQGLAVGLIGLNGVIASMFTVDADGGISDSGGLLLLVSLVLGVWQASCCGSMTGSAAWGTLWKSGYISRAFPRDSSPRPSSPVWEPCPLWERSMRALPAITKC